VQKISSVDERVTLSLVMAFYRSKKMQQQSPWLLAALMRAFSDDRKQIRI
jgi:hypothetical protein